jgi:hypothetical protein
MTSRIAEEPPQEVSAALDARRQSRVCARGERLLHHEDDLVALEGFLQKLCGTPFHRLDRQRNGGVRGQHDHRQLGPLRDDAVEELHAVHTRHAEIGEHRVGGVAFEPLQRFGARPYLGRLNALLTEHRRQHLAHGGIIIDQEYGTLRARHPNSACYRKAQRETK